MKFSIIIPVYNAEKTLKRCIDSILDQRYADFELILIDDRSTDKSMNICKEYSEMDFRIKLIAKTKNSGPSDSRNCGIDTASGEYIVFIDADDYIDNLLLQNLYLDLKETQSDMVFFGYKARDKNDKEIEERIFHRKVVKDRDISKISYELIKDEIFGYQWSKAIKTALIKDNEIKLDGSLSLNEDMIFTCQCCKKARDIDVLDIAPYNYIIGDNTLCTKYRKDMYDIQVTVCKRLFQLYSDMDIYNKDELILERNIISILSVLKNMKKDSSSKDKYSMCKEITQGYLFDVLSSKSDSILKYIKGKKKIVLYILAKTRSSILLFLVYKAMKK